MWYDWSQDKENKELWKYLRWALTQGQGKFSGKKSGEERKGGEASQTSLESTSEGTEGIRALQVPAARCDEDHSQAHTTKRL